jgi:hypothetical protein
MEKLVYTNAEMDVVALRAEDVIATSGGPIIGNGGGDNMNSVDGNGWD